MLKQLRARGRKMGDHAEIAVYQAYSAEIGSAALAAQTLAVPGFRLTRMTWIKPSYLWMAYRCGWSQKDAGQVITLRLWIAERDFMGFLKAGVLSHYDRQHYASKQDWSEALRGSDIRIQWDPERDAALEPIAGCRSLQVGLQNQAVGVYIDAISEIEDVSAEMKALSALSLEARKAALEPILAAELPVELSAEIAEIIGASK